MLLFALCFEDKHATLVKSIAGHHIHNMSAKYGCFLSCMTLFHAF